MNKRIRVLILIVLGAVLVYLGADLGKKFYYKSQGEEIIKELPDLDLKDLQGETFNLRDLPEDRNSLIVYYNSECIHCIDELESLRDNSLLFGSYNIVFVSIEDSRLTKKFLKKMKVDQSHGFTFLSDPKWEFPLIFDIEATPTLFFYDKNQKLFSENIGGLPYDVVLARLTDN